jgi:aminomuconate-semialdehyde/2-hydroxymuconate-6-semialdehyde dehydrogenase
MLEVERKGAPPHATGAVKDIRNFIAGEFVAGARSFDKYSPVDGALIARVAEAGAAEIDAAVKAARNALGGPWGKMPLGERCDLLYAVANEINRRFDDFLDAEVADTGKPVTLASHLDIPRGAANFKVTAAARSMTHCARRSAWSA